MGKNSVDTSLTETLIYKALDLKTANYVRSRLVMETSNCWYFLYTNSYEIFATSEWGSRLSKERVSQLQAMTKKFELELLC